MVKQIAFRHSRKKKKEKRKRKALRTRNEITKSRKAKLIMRKVKPMSWIRRRFLLGCASTNERTSFSHSSSSRSGSNCRRSLRELAVRFISFSRFSSCSAVQDSAGSFLLLLLGINLLRGVARPICNRQPKSSDQISVFEAKAPGL